MPPARRNAVASPLPVPPHPFHSSRKIIRNPLLTNFDYDIPKRAEVHFEAVILQNLFHVVCFLNGEQPLPYRCSQEIRY